MRNWMFIISIFLLVACDEVAYLRNDEKPVLVLYAVLEAGSDSMRIELTETKGTYDKTPWRRFPEAEVRVYEEGELLGMAEYQPADSSFVLRQPGWQGKEWYGGRRKCLEVLNGMTLK